jgi:uncharacterized membrane protein
VQVTHDEVRVIHEAGDARRTLWVSPTAFTRIEVDKSDERVSSVRVRLSRRSLSIGAALGPEELGDLAASLQAAITTALAERHA